MKSKKLILNLETVRTLTAQEAQHVEGAGVKGPNPTLGSGICHPHTAK